MITVGSRKTKTISNRDTVNAIHTVDALCNKTTVRVAIFNSHLCNIELVIT